MSYLVLARKWRPQTFADITGQEHVTRTLTHAIEQDRVHHAFLFCGARGVGKTSAARVLAKALNCEQGPTATPCGECNPCREIAAGNAIDVFEIDGASNRGIGEIRELREGVAYAPQRDRFKIYIIDEVHMLTTEAFNALLKTLEEPPSHVKFVFATTEPQKIPVTILSRCQRFDFKRIPLEVMTKRLREILAAEEVSVADGGLRLVARESEGSMRDALSLLDRIISFCGHDASYEQVAGTLGVADRSWLRHLVEAALGHDAPAALAVVQEAFHYGVDLKQFASDLVHYLRDIVVLNVAGREGGLTDLADEEANALADLGGRHQVEDLERLFRMATHTAQRLSQAPFPRLEMEMAVVRMCRMKPLRPIDRIIDRIAAIERYLESGAPLPPPNPDGGGGGGGAEAPSRPEPTSQPPPPASASTAPPTAPPAQTGPPPAAPPSASARAEAPSAPQSAPAPEAATPSAEPTPEPAPAAPEAAEPVPEGRAERPNLRVVEPPEPEPEAQSESEAPVTGREPMSEPEPEPEAPATAEKPTPEPEPEVDSEPEPPTAAEPEQAAEAEPEPDPSCEETLAAAAATAPATFGHDDWEVFVDAVRADDPALAGHLDAGQIVDYRDGVLRLAFQRGAYTTGEARDRRAALLKLLQQHVGGIRQVDVEELESVDETPFKRREARRLAELAARRKAIAEHPKVQALVEQFDGELARVVVYEGTGDAGEERTG
ncbi:MAG: DNA polymerase III subunit gamma/tau [Myxococcota bacterium]